MSVLDQIMQITKENNGIKTTTDITNRGILRRNLKNLVYSGKLKKTARGVYNLPDILEDEFISLQARFRKGIFLTRPLYSYGI